MKINKLAKAAKLLENLKQFDAEILEIERYAMEIANEECVVTLQLSVENKDKEAPSEEFRLPNPMEIYSFLIPRYVAVDQHKSTKSKSLAHNITETETLMVLGVLLQIKQHKRKNIIHQLQSMNVDI